MLVELSDSLVSGNLPARPDKELQQQQIERRRIVGAGFALGLLAAWAALVPFDTCFPHT
jgi:hypothetical protein